MLPSSRKLWERQAGLCELVIGDYVADLRAQPQWSGAYDGFATGSLDRDVEEVESLVKLLRDDGKSFRRTQAHEQATRRLSSWVIQPAHKMSCTTC
jgi:hypothetical protein